VNPTNLDNRKYMFWGFLIVIGIIYTARLFALQIVDSTYKENAESNALLRKTIYPSRGLIYDRNGELLVYNRPAYDVMITMRETEAFDTLAFCNIVNITKEDFRKRIVDIKKGRGYSSYTPQLLIAQLSPREYGILQEQLYRYPGFDVQARILREYSFPNAAHILGSIGEVSQKDIDKDAYYKRGDYSGRDGIESTYEEHLRGVKGAEIFLRDSRGRIQGRANHGEDDKRPTSGESLTLSIDIALQAYGELLMQGKIGSAVAIEPATGEILAMVSNPGFDPSLLVGRERGKNYAALVKNPHKPLMNRATQATYSPGSTFKTVQALVALHEGAITPETLFPCNGPGSSPIKCTHHHGSPVALLNAVEQSCNPYFWQAYQRLLTKDGSSELKNNYDKWREDMLSFNLGRKFDSDIYQQVSGNIPTREFYDRVYGGRWNAMTIRSNSIGQGEVLLTPLQMANTVSIIANRGFYCEPHLARVDSFGVKIQTNVEQQYFEPVVEGMWRVCEFGTGRWYKIPDVPMCGKTGTVQNSRGKDHSIFVGFAPKDNPTIAIAVVVENAGFGATWANPIASLMMEKYLKRDIAPERKFIEERMTAANFMGGAE
jgi:penicillin-binding protein 2